MKFLCDVHIPYKLSKHLEKLGYESTHINLHLDKWYTKDNKIIAYADSNDMILISKDSDFRDSYFVKGSPKKLIKINLGNISNQELIEMIEKNIKLIKQLSKKEKFCIEIDKDGIVIYE